MGKHTPGPWHFSQTHEHKITIRNGSEYVAEITLGDGPEWVPVDEANARLITAAPALLESIRGLMRVLDEPEAELLRRAFRPQLEDVRAAIESAEGICQ